MRLVFMAMCRNSIRCRCQLHLIGSLGYDAIACFYAGKDLYTFAIVGTQGDKLFFVALFIQLQVDKEAALFLGQSRMGECNNVLHRRGEQEYLDK